ncbi:3-hydroxyisobutyrate dehydrogenase [uncultured Tessaracoccus sp.]|uniref:3-hydroxyisobutyrate dehydrogenase n=1 Tax=uncultured Tessaracoccus sp. TaxID=905023 RepID=UPI00345C4CE9
MQIAWIGLGNMGRPMAHNLVKAGFAVRGTDIVDAVREAAAQDGVETADTIADAVRDADVVVTMLPKAQHVSAVLEDPDGVLAHAPAGAVIVDSSTIDVDAARRLHRRVADAGLEFLDAPVSGGVSGAAAGTLTFMVGGEAATLERVRPMIEPMAGKIFHLGDAGKGQAAKAVNNMMLGISVAAMSEGAALAQRLGLDAAAFHSLLTVSSGDSWAVRKWYPIPGIVETAASNRDFEPGFSVDLLAKDMGLALAAGEGAGVPLRHAQLVAADLQTLIDRGDGGKDCSWFFSLVTELH